MQATNALYQALLAADADREVRAGIGSTTYNRTKIISAKTTQALGKTSLPVGNCVASQLDLALWNAGAVPRMAEIALAVRLNSGAEQSDWLPKGTYFVDTREYDAEDDVLTLHAFDAMLKTEQSYTQPGEQGLWPRTDASVVADIAQRIGVALDARTTAIMDKGYLVQYPGILLEDGTPQYSADGGLSMREILGYIGVMYGGNWIISDAGALRLVLLASSTAVAVVELGQNVSTLNTSPTISPVSRIALVVGTGSDGAETVYTAGTDTGRELRADCPWATQSMAEDLLETLGGYVYQPFEATDALLDPAAELGDSVEVGGITSQIMGAATLFDALYTADIGAPQDEEIDHEYEFISTEDRQLRREISKNRVSFVVGMDQIRSSVSDLATQTESQILQLADSITLSVSTATGAGGQTYASIELRVGEEMFTGQILLDGNVNVSGQLSADALYTTYGDMAALTVDRVRTSRRIPLYLAQNTNDDNFIDIVGERMILYAGVYDATLAGEYLDANDNVVTTTGYTQAKNPNNEPIFWESDPDASDVVIGTDGYPYRNGVRIFTTTQNSGYPVFVYTYNEQAKGRIGFEQNYLTGYYEPKITLGVGDESGHNIAHINKTSEALEVLLDATGGKNVGMVAGANGALDLYGLRKTTRLDFSAFDYGSFTETLDGNVTNYYSVAFGEIDGVRVPTKITDAEGHETEVLW